MSQSQLRLDVREVELATTYVYIWVLQTTLPVTDEFRSCRTFPTRAAAVADFDEVADRLGWEVGG